MLAMRWKLYEQEKSNIVSTLCEYMDVYVKGSHVTFSVRMCAMKEVMGTFNAEKKNQTAFQMCEYRGVNVQAKNVNIFICDYYVHYFVYFLDLKFYNWSANYIL